MKISTICVEKRPFSNKEPLILDPHQKMVFAFNVLIHFKISIYEVATCTVNYKCCFLFESPPSISLETLLWECLGIFCASGVIIKCTTMRFLWYKLRDSVWSLNALSSMSSRISSVGNSSYAEGFNYTVIESNYSISLISDKFNAKCLSLFWSEKYH